MNVGCGKDSFGKVSIIMPCYNAGSYISEAIDSVRSQTYYDWELIVVDDGSTDNSSLIVEAYATLDERIKRLKNTDNPGAAGARNTALKNCTGQYVAFLDADDLWYSEKLKKQLYFMSTNNYDFTYSYVNIIDENSRYLRTLCAPSKVNAKTLKITNYIPCLTVIYRRSAASEIFSPLIKSRNDFALWLRILNQSQIKEARCIPEILGAYRENSYGIASNKWNSLKYFWVCQYRFNNGSILGSTLRTLLYVLMVVVKKKFPSAYSVIVKDE